MCVHDAADVAKTYLQLSFLQCTKLIDFRAECELISKMFNRMIEQVEETFIVCIVLRLNIRECHRFVENVFIEGTRKIAVEQFVVVDGLRYDTTNKLQHTRVNNSQAMCHAP